MNTTKEMQLIKSLSGLLMATIDVPVFNPYLTEIVEFDNEVRDNLFELDKPKQKLYIQKLIQRFSLFKPELESVPNPPITKKDRNLVVRGQLSLIALGLINDNAKLFSIEITENGKRKYDVSSIALAIAIMRLHNHITKPTDTYKEFSYKYGGTPTSIPVSLSKNKFQALSMDKEHSEINSLRLSEAREIIAAEGGCPECLQKIKKYESNFL